MSGRRRGRWACLLPAVALAAGLGALSAAAVSPKTELGIGVAPFEHVAPPGIEMPDVAALLADRLAAQGLSRVKGPTALGGPVEAAPSGAQLRQWGTRAEVDAIVTGRATRLGLRTSIDLRVRSAGDGQVLATFVEEAPAPDQLAAALERLAARIAVAAGQGLPGVSSPPPPAPAPVAADAPATSPPQGGTDAPAPPALSLRSDAPISIRSDELEVLQEQGRRRLLFTRNVRVSQEDVTLEANRLEAFYPAGSSQPERLVASGRVRVAQLDPERSMRCDQAVYLRRDQRVRCEGHAELQQGNDRVRGERIEIFLDSGRLQVTGGAIVNFRPQAGDSAPEASP